MAAPVFGRMSTEYNDEFIAFVKVDVDKTKDIAGANGVSAMPTFVLIENGTKVCSDMI